MSIVINISDTEKTLIFNHSILFADFSDDFEGDGDVEDKEPVTLAARTSTLKITLLNGSEIELEDEEARRVWKIFNPAFVG